jgi:hypothetical protein
MLMVGVLVALFVFAVILSFAGISTFGPCALVCICLFSATLAAIQLEMLPSEDLRNEIRRRHVEHPLLLPALFAASMLVALYFCAVDLPLYEMAAPKPKTYTTHKMDQVCLPFDFASS